VQQSFHDVSQYLHSESRLLTERSYIIGTYRQHAFVGQYSTTNLGRPVPRCHTVPYLAAARGDECGRGDR